MSNCDVIMVKFESGYCRPTSLHIHTCMYNYSYTYMLKPRESYTLVTEQKPRSKTRDGLFCRDGERINKLTS